MRFEFLGYGFIRCITVVEALNSQVIDSHCWKFTPFIFSNIIHILYETKYIDLRVERIYNTLKGSNEFYVILKKC
jgi:hypothetical protein